MHSTSAVLQPTHYCSRRYLARVTCYFLHIARMIHDYYWEQDIDYKGWVRGRSMWVLNFSPLL